MSSRNVQWTSQSTNNIACSGSPLMQNSEVATGRMAKSSSDRLYERLGVESRGPSSAGFEACTCGRYHLRKRSQDQDPRDRTVTDDANGETIQ